MKYLLLKKNKFIFKFNQSRNLKITHEFIGSIVKIYNGKIYILVEINKFMVGHRFGEFAFTHYIGYKNKKD